MRTRAAGHWLIALTLGLCLSLAASVIAERVSASPQAHFAFLPDGMGDGDELILKAGQYPDGLVIDADANAPAMLRVADADLREAATATSTLRLILIDAAGQRLAAPFVLLDESGSILAESGDDLPLAVSPGLYQLAAQQDLGLSTSVQIAAGETMTVHLEAPRSLWLPFARDDPAHPLILFRALPDAETRRLIRSHVIHRELESIRAFPRLAASAEEIEQALDLARKAILPLGQEPITDAEAAWKETAQARVEARRILAVHGKEEDAALLLNHVLPFWGDGIQGALAAAYAEARLGRLENGVVRAAIDTQDENRRYAVASALQAFGQLEADAELLRWIETASALTSERFLVLARSMDLPEITEAYRKLVGDFIHATRAGETAYFPHVGLEHLIAFGSDADWKLLSDALALADPNLHVSIAATLAPYAADPLMLTGFIAEEASKDSLTRAQVGICQLLRLRGPDAFARINQAIQEQINARWRALNNSRDTYIQYLLDAGGCWPNETAARYYHTGESKLGKKYFGQIWMPEPWHESEILARDAEGTLSGNYFDLTDHIPIERIVAAHAAASNSSIADPQLRIAYRKTVTRAGQYAGTHAYEDGLERRPYLLRHIYAPDYSGAISGMAVVDPQLHEDGALSIRLRLEQVPYYHGCCDLASTIANDNNLSAWLHAPYLDHGGSELVKSIRLFRFGEEVPVRVTGPHARGWRIEAEPSDRGLAGLYLMVELDLFGDRRELIFDLFASGRARGFGDRLQ